MPRQVLVHSEHTKRLVTVKDTEHGVFLDLYARFEARSRGGLHTLDCELLEDGVHVYLEYVIVAPFTSKGERRRQTWCWSSDYPKERLMKEAKKEAHKLACQMWGEQPLEDACAHDRG